MSFFQFCAETFCCGSAFDGLHSWRNLSHPVGDEAGLDQLVLIAAAPMEASDEMEDREAGKFESTRSGAQFDSQGSPCVYAYTCT